MSAAGDNSGIVSDMLREAVELYARPLIPHRDRRGYLVDRALVACGRVFGLRKRQMRSLVKSLDRVRLFGKPTLADIVPLPLPLEPGFVYHARLTDFPHIRKIGWTSNPKRREIELCREAGALVEMGRIERGNTADEALDLLKHRADHVTVEWFVDRQRPFKGVPPFMSAIERDPAMWERALADVAKRANDGFIMDAHAILYSYALARAA